MYTQNKEVGGKQYGRGRMEYISGTRINRAFATNNVDNFKIL